MPHMKAFGLSIEMKNFFLKKNQIGWQKLSFSSSANSQYFFVKNFVDRNDWFKGHWCGSQAVWQKLKNWVRTQKMHFTPFLSLCRTAWWLYRLSHINSLTRGPIHEIFMKKYEELVELENDILFCFFVFGYWVVQFFSQWKDHMLSCEVAFTSALWIVSLES